MPNIFEAVHELNATKKEQATKLVLAKSRKELSLEASSQKASSVFRLVDIDISKVPFLSAGKDDGPIIVDLNVHGLRKTKSGFVPKILVVSGLDKLKAAKRSEALVCSAWVGDKVLCKISIMADDAISSNDLQSKLNKLISAAYTPTNDKNRFADGNYPYIVEIYPFENYLIFQKGGDKFRQNYKLDAIMREVSLDGKPVPVFEQYVNIPDSKGVKSITSGSDIQEALLDKPNAAAPVLGGFNGPIKDTTFADIIVDYGAPGSEANNPMYKLMLNVEDALAQYQIEKTDGIHKVIYTPYAAVPPGLINAGREARIAASCAGVALDSFSVMDFLRWQNTKMSIKSSVRTKRVDGKDLPMSAFAKVGDPADISTWHAAKTAGPHTGKGKSAERELKKMKLKREIKKK